MKRVFWYGLLAAGLVGVLCLAAIGQQTPVPITGSGHQQQAIPGAPRIVPPDPIPMEARGGSDADEPWQGMTQAPVAASMTTTWVDGYGLTETVTTPQNAGESAEDWAARHWKVVAALKLLAPPVAH